MNIISYCLGFLPEIVYFSLSIIVMKDIKQKRVLLSVLIGISYILTSFFNFYSVYSYIIFIILSFMVLKLINRKQTYIIDLFVNSVIVCYAMIVSFFSFKIFHNNYESYYIAFMIDRILLFLPFLLFRKKYNQIYNRYKMLWNRNYKEKVIIKSLTLRGISLIFINILILGINIFTFIIVDYMKWR